MPDRPAAHGGDAMGIRASDSEREAVAQQLSAAMAEGRLDIAEYEHRLDLAMSATKYGELVPLTADLPASAETGDMAQAPPEPAEPAEAGPSKWLEYANEWRSWLGGAIIMIGIWAVLGVVDGEFSNFWPAIPLGIWAAILVAGLVWPDDDDKPRKAKKRHRGC